MNLLRIHELDAFYGSAQILDKFNIKIEKGERVAVLGRNGVGKTTIINSLDKRTDNNIIQDYNKSASFSSISETSEQKD